MAEYIDGGPHGDGSRPTLFSANREGILSCAGYLAVYLASIELGQWLFRHRYCNNVDVILKLIIILLLIIRGLLTFIYPNNFLNSFRLIKFFKIN